MKVDYQQYLVNRASDLDKLSSILPELMVNQEELKIALGIVSTSSIIRLLEGFRRNLCELLGREVHPAECDVYVRVITQMAMASAIKDITANIIENKSLEDLLDTEKMVNKLVEKTCNNLGAIIHGFDRDEIKKFFENAIHDMLSKLGGLQNPNLGDIFGDDTPST